MAISKYPRQRLSPPPKPVPAHKRFAAGRYRRVALVYIIRAISLPLFIGTLAYGIYTDNQTLKYAALIILGLFFLLSLIFLTFSSQVTCRICKTPFLKHLKCAKKRGKIPHFLGDRSLATAISLVLRRKHITCQYCAERHLYFE